MACDAIFLDISEYSVRQIKSLIKKYNGVAIFVVRKQDCELTEYFKGKCAICFDVNTANKIIIMALKIFYGFEGEEPKKYKTRINSIERSILNELKFEKSNKEIARDLDLPLSTVKYYISQLLRKFDVKNRTQVALIAKETGV